MSDEELRSRRARIAAESALVRVVHHYGDRPEFVVLGGLVPELLCVGSEFRHAGTTDIRGCFRRRDGLREFCVIRCSVVVHGRAVHATSAQRLSNDYNKL